METSSDLIEAQSINQEADQALYEAKWEIAIEKYNQAISVYKRIFEGSNTNTTDPKIQLTVQKNLERCIEVVKQLSDYISGGSNQSIRVSDDEEMTSDPFVLQSVFLDPSETNLSLWNNIWDQFEKLMGFLPSPTPLNNSNRNELSDSSFIVINNSSSKDTAKDTEKKEANNEQIVQKLKDEIEDLRAENDAITLKYEILLKQQNVPNAVKDLLHENTMLKKSISTFRYQIQKHTESMRASIIMPGLTPATTQSRLPPPQIINRLIVPNDENITQLKLKLAHKEKEVKELQKYKKKYDKIMEKAKQKKGSSYVDYTTSGDSRSTTYL